MMVDGKKITYFILLIISALLVGILYVAPQFFIGRALKAQDRPHLVAPYNLHSDEMINYLPRGREVYDGHFFVSDLFSDRKLFSPTTALPPLIMSLPIFVAGGNINFAYQIAQFSFSALIFLAFYFLGKVVLRSRSWSFFLAFAATLTPLARDLPRGFFSLDSFLNKIVKNFVPIVQTQFDHLALYRMDDPLITFLIFIPTLIALFVFWQNPKKSTAVLFGALVGLLVYTYLHYWMYLALVLFLLTVYAFFNRRKDSARFYYLAISCAVFLLFALPYILNILNISNLNFVADWRDRNNAEEIGRQIYLSSTIPHYIFYAILALAVYWVFWKQKKQDTAVLWWSFIGVMPLLLNMQIMVGFNVAPDHWFFAFSPLALLLILSIAIELVKKIDKKWIVAALLILISLVVAKKIVNAFTFINPMPEVLEAHTIDRPIIDSWDWINQDLPDEPRIGSTSFLTSAHLAVYTSARPYLPTFFNTYLTNEEGEERVLQMQKLFGASPEFLGILFRAKGRSEMTCEEIRILYKNPLLKCSPLTLHNLTDYFYPFYYYYFREKDYSTINSVYPHLEMPEERVRGLLNRYEDMPSLNWRDLPLDYVYSGPLEKELAGSELENNPELKMVYEKGGVEIYEIIRQ